VMKEIDRSRPLFRESSMYAQYLRCLGVLLERTEPDAPAFLHKEAWKIKTCQTALAGWAQMRHTWALQAKQGARYVCGSSCEAGFVEPIPEFYGRLAKLVEAMRDALQKAGALGAVNTKEMIKELTDDLHAAVKIVEKARKQKKGLDSLSSEEKSLLAQFDSRLNDLWDRPEKERDSEKALSEVAHLLEVYQELARGNKPVDWYFLGFDISDLADHWSRLARVCHRLEVLAQKQLRQVPVSKKENEFLRAYGKELAHIMLYGGNSYFDPRDDAPRIVDVFTNPVADKHLLVGTARPRVLWVLYPVKGTDILCRGAVLPYQEFAHAERLTDSAWKSLLDSPQRPELPDWIRPVTAPESSSKQRKGK